MGALGTALALSILVVGLAAGSNGLCDEDLYIHTSGPVTVNLSLECNTTFFRRTGIIDAGGQSSHYFSYYFGVRCVDANNSQTEMLVLENGVSFPEEHDLTTDEILVLQYGWRCVLFGCYDFFGSPPSRYAVTPALCTIDEDECSTGSHNCSERALCINTIGSYQCTCSDGYDGDGFNCTDVNECQQGEYNCSKYAKCHNLPGSYTCQCSDAYYGDGNNCTDVDECLTSPDICGPNSKCNNVAGGYFCSCSEGYSMENQCIDVNECESDSHNCSENGMCLNFPGGYTCSCAAGYTGDGFNCTRSVQFSRVKLVVVLMSLMVFVVLAMLLATAVSCCTCVSRRKQLWLYAFKVEWETQNVNEDFRPVDPVPSVFSGSLRSIIEPLQKQYDPFSEETKTLSDEELENETRSYCSSVEQANQTGGSDIEEKRVQSADTSEISVFPDFQFEDPQEIETQTGDGTKIFPVVCSSFSSKDESGFASDTSSFQYLSFYKLRQQS